MLQRFRRQEYFCCSKQNGTFFPEKHKIIQSKKRGSFFGRILRFFKHSHRRPLHRDRQLHRFFHRTYEPEVSCRQPRIFSRGDDLCLTDRDFFQSPGRPDGRVRGTGGELADGSRLFRGDSGHRHDRPSDPICGKPL